LWGRRIHIAGSIHPDPAVASAAEVAAAVALLSELVPRLVARGAGFVIPVDAEKLHLDGRPVCFDWTVWEAVANALVRRPAMAPSPFAVAVQHHKSELQIPTTRETLWDSLRSSDLVVIENAAHWNMNGKRMEAAARWGDVLLALGGGEGVHFLANLYHEAGKPVVPLNLALSPADQGALHLFNYGLRRSQSSQLFQVREGPDSHAWLNRINFSARRTPAERAEDIIALLEALERPRAFVVRLLNDKHPDFLDVERFFDSIVQPVIEDELGFKLTVVDGRQSYDFPRVDQEIFEKLHRSGVVVADITGVRPNCFVELGYALGRGHSTLLTARAGTENPFDTYTIPSHFWDLNGRPEEGREAFRTHWAAAIGRPPLVSSDPLIP
jgi:hypothetical protein